MIADSIALYNDTNGRYMIYFFGLVCLGLITMLVLFMRSGKKKK